MADGSSSTHSSVHGQQHLLVLAERLEEEKAKQDVKFRVRKRVQEEREKSMQQSRSIRIYNISYQCNAQLVAEWFQQLTAGFGNLLSVTLTPHRNYKSPADWPKHNGTGLLEFAASETVLKLEEIQGVKVDSLERCVLKPCAIAKDMTLRFHRYMPKKALLGKGGSEHQLLFKTRLLQMGNLVSKSEAVYGLSLESTTEVRLTSHSLVWELQLQNNRYRFEMAFKHVAGKGGGFQVLEGGQVALLIPIRMPPKVYRLPLTQGSSTLAIESVFGSAPEEWGDWVEDLEGSSRGSSLRGTQPEEGSAEAQMEWAMDPEKWMRTTDFTHIGAIGSSYLYRFSLPFTKDELNSKGNKVKEQLWNSGILCTSGILEKTDITDSVLNIDKDLDARLACLPYIVQYYLECFTSSGMIARQQLDTPLVDTLSRRELPGEVIIQALSILLGKKQRIPNPTSLLRSLIKDILHDLQAKRDLSRPLPEYCMMVWRVMVTPTRIVRLPPETELSNRVLRRFKSYSDHFLRLSFGEENSSLLHLGPKASTNSDLVRRMEAILRDGIDVAGRHFEFLAFSTSQLKEHSVWFFAPVPEINLTADSVRQWMGDFKNIRCVAKYAARMGQCFSSTLDTVELKDDQVVQIPDVERNGYVFSDGGGIITMDLANQVSEYLKQQGRLSTLVAINPIAFQVRFGGCKGVVVAYPDLRAGALQRVSNHPQGTQGRKIFVRPSMQKFEATARKIEVVGTSRFLPAFLNRQIISILFQKSLGVPDRVFKKLQDDMLETLNRMLEDGRTAMHVLREYASLESEGLVSSIQGLILAGFDLATEPYLRGLLSAIRMHLLKDLKQKTRIFVPQAALLMGVMDEIGVLEYGEVFVRIDKSPLLDSPQTVVGEVIVAKNPCFHPGDVRVLRAVDKPELRHLCNVVVFPQRGHRPHPNEITGSDLDGDNFFCSWMRSLIPPQRTCAMDFPQAIPKELTKDVDIHDVAAFFVDHAISDNLGIIANAHLAMSDKAPKGVLDEGCIRLANLHSQAVDFPKTGVLVEVPKELRPASFPGFMMSKHKPSYQSRTIIGTLFRELEDPPKTLPYTPQRHRCDPDLVVEGFETFIEGAKRTRVMYEQQLIMIMNQFNVLDEYQLVSGCITEWDVMRKRRNGKRFDARTHIVEAVQALRGKFARIFSAEMLEMADVEDHQKLAFRKASAWYQASYDPKFVTEGSDPRVQLYSFPWVISNYLAEIKRSRRCS